MKKFFTAILLCLLSSMVNAEVLYQGGSTGTYQSGTVAFSAPVFHPNQPRTHAADLTMLPYCQTEASHCLVANATKRQISLFSRRNEVLIGVVAWDVIMLPPSRVMHGYLVEIDLDPTWCPPASVRLKFPDLPAGCLEAGDPLNAMGEVKFIMDGDFTNTAIRIHDTPGFGPEWPNEDSSGCVRVLDLKQTIVPLIGSGATKVVFVP